VRGGKPEADLRSGGHLSRLALMEWKGGLMEGADRADAETHLKTCVRCASRLEAFKAEAAEFEKEFPTWPSVGGPVAPARLGRPARVEAAPSLWERVLELLRPGPGPRIAFASLLVLAALGTTFWMRGPGPVHDGLSPKGKEAASFYLFVNGVQALTDTVKSGPGDSLQLGLIGEKPVHYAVLYRDDESPIEPYMVDKDGTQKPLGSPDGDNLPHSLILKGEWKREVLYCLWSPRRFTLAEALARARQPADAASDIRLRTLVLKATP
jgi:hypothetical protein